MDRVFGSFASIPHYEAREIVLTTAGASRDGIAVGCLGVCFENDDGWYLVAATSVLPTEWDDMFLGDIPAPKPPPSDPLAAEWYALGWGLNRIVGYNRITVCTLSRPILDVLRGVLPVSRRPWLRTLQQNFEGCYALKNTRRGGREYLTLQTRRDPERRTRTGIDVTTSDHALLIPRLADPREVHSLQSLAKRRVEAEIQRRTMDA